MGSYGSPWGDKLMLWVGMADGRAAQQVAAGGQVLLFHVGGLRKAAQKWVVGAEFSRTVPCWTCLDLPFLPTACRAWVGPAW